MTTSSAADWPAPLRTALVDALLAAADDDFFIGHMDSDWTGLAPIIEEDIAMSSIAQDEIAHARELYQLIGELTGRSADDVAYGRRAEEYRCAGLILRADDFDWARLIARQFYYDHFDSLRLASWKTCAYGPLANVANRIAAEESFHVHHVNDWLCRLGRAGGDGRARIQAALDELWPAAAALFEATAGADRLTELGIAPAAGGALCDQFLTRVRAAIQAAGLKPASGTIDPASLPLGGRGGRHDPRLAEVLEELAEVYRIEPGATW